MILKPQIIIRKLIDIQPAAVLMFLKIQCNNNRLFCALTVSYDIFYFILIWTADIRWYNTDRSDNKWDFVSDIAVWIIWKREVIAAVHLNQVTYQQSVSTLRYHLCLLTCSFPCCGLIEGASFATCLWRVTKAEVMKAIIDTLIWEWDHVVPAHVNMFIEYVCSFSVCLAVVKTQFWCVKWIEEVFLQQISQILRLN